jgi:Glycosyltransferase family 87
MKSRNSSLDVLRGVAILVLLCDFAMAAMLLPRVLNPDQHFDFASFYFAGKHLRTNPPILFTYREQSPFIHPAYELLLFVPLSLLSYRAAYFAWALLSVGLLIFIWRTLKLPWELLAFAPIFLTLVMGQDPILMFACVALAWWAATKGKAWVSGLWLGLAMFRFQNILIIIALLAIWKEWRVLKGWLLSAGLVTLLSALLASPTAYIRVLMALSHSSGRYVQWTDRMVNLRGLISTTAPESQWWLLPLVSILVFCLAVWRGWKESLEYRLRLDMIAVALVSFHLYAHDLVLLLIPMACLLKEVKYGALIVSAVVLIALLPVFNSYIYLTCLGTAILFATELYRQLTSVADDKQAGMAAADARCQTA